MKTKLAFGQRMQHPNLSDDHLVTSKRDKRYNCASWAVGRDFTTKVLDPRKMPGTIWPAGISRNYKVGSYMKAYATYGYHPCGTSKLEKGFVKIALYEDGDGDFTHASRQLPNGTWTSKLGANEDISHSTPEEMEGGDYGKCSIFMKKALPP